MTDPLIHRIDSLESAARVLDPDPAARERLRNPVVAYAEQFLNRLHGSLTYVTTADKGREIGRAHV